MRGWRAIQCQIPGAISSTDPAYPSQPELQPFRVLDRLVARGRLEHHLDDLLDTRIVGRAHLRNCGFDVVLGAPELHIGSEERPVGTPFTLVCQTDAAGAQNPNPVDLPVVPNMDMGGDHDSLVDACHELADALRRRSLRDALLVRTRQP